MDRDETDEFHYRPELIRKRAITIALSRLMLIMFVLWMTIMMGFIAWTTYEAEQQRDRLIDCTTPGGRCFEDSQKRTADAVGNLNEITVFAAACADKAGVNTVAQIQACVLDELEKSHGSNTKTDR